MSTTVQLAQPIAIPPSLWIQLRSEGMICLPRREVVDDDFVWPVADDQQQAIAEMKACQIVQTGYAGPKRRATEDERAWAENCWRQSQERTAAERVPGTCSGCNSDPCQCLA